jgi:hypothetical protein
MGVKLASACYRELGAHLTALRNAAGLSGDAIANRAEWSRSKVWRIENGWSDLSVCDVVHYVVLCGVTLPEAADILELARLAERKAGYWLNDKRVGNTLGALIFHESSASNLIAYAPQLVPGLLQTPAYANARITGEPGLTAGEAAAGMRTRMQRQEILSWANPAQFTFFLHEQALRLQVGSPTVMQEQLLHIVFTTALHHVAVRIVPAAAGERSAFGGPFQLMEYAKHRPLVYLDHVGGGLFLEDSRYVESYHQLLPELTAVSLDEEESRSFVAALADEYDRGSQPDAVQRMEEEQL